MQRPIARKDQLDSHAGLIDVILSPSCSLPSTFFGGRHTLHSIYPYLKTQPQMAFLGSEISVKYKSVMRYSEIHPLDYVKSPRKR